MPPRTSGSTSSPSLPPGMTDVPPGTSVQSAPVPSSASPRVINIVPKAESEGNPTAGIDPNIPLETTVTPKLEPIVKGTTKPYVVNGETITPMSEINPFTQTGHASWYGKKFHGRKTASGELYDMYKLSAAHKTLPIPSYVQVTNLDNHKSVVVRVNDRGPFGRPRIIDLSYAAAKQLDIIRHGSAQVEITLIDPAKPINTQTEKISPGDSPTSTEKSVPTTLEEKGIYVQVGAFGQEENADRLKQRISNAMPETQTLINKVYNGKVFQVILGPYPDHALATQTASEMRDQLQLPALIFSR